jgi:tRNA-specific 2-thiouridylase
MNRKAVILFSGGLDSILAAWLLLEQQIEIKGINFRSIFFTRAETAAAADNLGLDLEVFDITQEHIRIVRYPQYGYGRNMNPCLDCRIYVLKRAAEYMQNIGAGFLVTGDVLDERPMSQRRDAFNLIEKASGLKGRILRPLSAKLLEPTIPEKEGIVRREELLDIQGRSRRPQIELARKKGIDYYPSPAGGCLLTDPGFSNRLRELLLMNRSPADSDIQLLRYGRHFRLSDGSKVIIARHEEEIGCLLDLTREGDMVFSLAEFPGPVAIVKNRDKAGHLNWIEDVAALTARYSKARDKKEVRVKYYRVPKKIEGCVSVVPSGAGEMEMVRV